MAFFVRVSGTIRDDINPAGVNFLFPWNQRASHFMISKVVPFFRSHSPPDIWSDVINTPDRFLPCLKTGGRLISSFRQMQWREYVIKYARPLLKYWWKSRRSFFLPGFILAFVIITIWTKRNVLRVILVRNKRLLNNQLANERLID